MKLSSERKEYELGGRYSPSTLLWLLWLGKFSGFCFGTLVQGERRTLRFSEKIPLWETLNLSTDADSSTDTKTDRNGQFFWWGSPILFWFLRWGSKQFRFFFTYIFFVCWVEHFFGWAVKKKF